MDKSVVRDATLLIVRCILGVVFAAHGWRILLIDGITETTGQFSAWGVPQPGLSAWIAALGQLCGGGLLIVGFLTTVVAGAMAVFVAAALYFVHVDSGLFVQDGGIEYPFVLIAALAVIVVFGTGRASVDGMLTR
ncbi:membrane protein [Corynebacterium atypicum]|uniref:Membrane protein n=1 Tax=Corynebacterium atypicum TaxID=191610 RepID=A0ABM5QMA0_9CORY|nr:DoxX family protein [Corynebacterium atypicum]AIG63870.1 membrane protein [Corynebacterium atypicum]